MMSKTGANNEEGVYNSIAPLTHRMPEQVVRLSRNCMRLCSGAGGSPQLEEKVVQLETEVGQLKVMFTNSVLGPHED